MKKLWIVLLATGLATATAFAQGIVSRPPGIVDDTASPVRASLSLDRLPLWGETATLECEITSSIYAPRATARIVLPPGVLLMNGSLEWEGDLGPQRPASFRAAVAFRELGNQKISCSTEYRLDADNGYGDLTSLFLSVGTESTLEGYAPVPFAERMPLAELGEAGDGIVIDEHPDQWQWDYIGREMPSAPHLEPLADGAEPPKASAQEKIQGLLTVTGTFRYFNRDGILTGAREFLVEVVRGDNSNHLAWCYTGLSGTYTCPPVNNPGSAGVRTIMHTYTKYSPNSDILIVKDPDFGGTSPNVAYRAQTGIVVLPDGTQNIGSWFLPSTSINTPAYWAHRDLVDTFRHIFFNGCADPAGPTTVRWEPDSTDGNFYRAGEDVHLTADAPDSTTVVIHEYSHNIMFNSYGFFPSTTNCNPHSINLDSSTTCAWTEGWAEYVPMAVTNLPIWEFTNGVTLNFETPSPSTFGWDDGPDVEGRVAGALWDVHDAVNDGTDTFQQANAFCNHYIDFDRQTDNTFQQFWNAWSPGLSNQTAAEASLAQNTIDFTPPPPPPCGFDGFCDPTCGPLDPDCDFCFEGQFCFDDLDCGFFGVCFSSSCVCILV